MKLFHKLEENSLTLVHVKGTCRNWFFRHRAIAAPSIDKTEQQVLIQVISLKYVSKSRQLEL